jgi:hypothetical protein
MESYLEQAGEGKTKEAVHERDRIIQVLNVLKKEMTDQLLPWEWETLQRMCGGKLQQQSYSVVCI